MLWPTSRTLVAGAVALAVGMGRVAPARADDLARQLYAVGVTAAQAHEWETARRFFLGAYEAKRHWQVAANLANVERELGMSRDVAEHAATFLHQTRALQSVGPAQRAQIERMLIEARAKVGAIHVIAPDGAKVFVQGSFAGTAPLPTPVFVDPGQAKIEAELAGYNPGSASRDLAAGEEVEVKVELWPATGDGSVDAGITQDRHGEITPPRSIAPTVILGVGAAAFLGAGVALRVASSDLASTADAKLTQLRASGRSAPCAPPAAMGCSTLSGLNRTSDQLYTLAVVSFIAAGGAGVAAATYGLRPNPRSQRSGVLVVPTVGTTGGGLSVSGAF